jgi:hypothetical protein
LEKFPVIRLTKCDLRLLLGIDADLSGKPDQSALSRPAGDDRGSAKVDTEDD